MITDEAIIKVKAGNGGNGAVSFRREKFVPKGGPDGGDGGRGGDIIFICDDNVHTLSDFARRKYFHSASGQAGRGKKQTGADGADLFLKVPAGTLLKKDEQLVFDFTKIGQKVLIVRGGRGGRGNVHFATATSQIPYLAEKGAPGEEKTLKLELKLLADIGFIGLPNAGKSTLLARLSNARPKIADYPFTTLEPMLGVIKIGQRQAVAADIPGLIAGAAEGRGLGDKFLRHIERTKILVHLIDIQSQNPAKDYRDLRAELGKWNKTLLAKEEIVVLNKADTLPGKVAAQKAADLAKTIKKPVLFISAVFGFGLPTLQKFIDILDSLKESKDAANLS